MSRFHVGQRVLIDNAIPATEECRWCSAEVGEVHSPACPCGERYQDIQAAGGIHEFAQVSA